MRAQADELQEIVAVLAIDQQQVRLDMAFSMIAPVPGQRMIAVPVGEWLVTRQKLKKLGQHRSDVPMPGRCHDPLVVPPKGV